MTEQKARRDYDSSEDGGKQLPDMIGLQQPVSFGPNGLSISTPKPQGLSTVGDPDERIEMELCADSQACDSMMPKDGACARIPIVPLAQSQRGMEYELANAQAIPCVG